MDDTGLSSSRADVSVVIPTIGRQSLVTSLVSVLAQDRVPEEVVIGVDSKFSLPAEIQERLERIAIAFDVRLVVLSDAGDGVSRVLNRAISAATLKYVALNNDDDVWLDQHLSRAMRALATGNCDVYGARVALLVDEVGTHLQPHASRTFPGEYELSRWFYDQSLWMRRPAGIPPMTLVLETRLAQSIPFDTRLIAREDFAWLMDIQAEGGAIRQFPSVDAVVRRDSRRSSARLSAEQSLLFAEHLEANAAGMGARFLARESAFQYLRHRRWADLAAVGKGLSDSTGFARGAVLSTGMTGLGRLMSRRDGAGRKD